MFRYEYPNKNEVNEVITQTKEGGGKLFELESCPFQVTAPGALLARTGPHARRGSPPPGATAASARMLRSRGGGGPGGVDGVRSVRASQISRVRTARQLKFQRGCTVSLATT
jgi:hypothetical protein